jgi:hypothetical protein
MGAHYAGAARTKMVDTHATVYPHMPPLVGSDDDLEALAAYLASLEDRDPADVRVARKGGE